MTVSAFWDQGWVRVNENQPAVNAAVANNRRISGYGIGGSLGKDGDFVVRASAAWRNEDVQNMPDDWEEAVREVIRLLEMWRIESVDLTKIATILAGLYRDWMLAHEGPLSASHGTRI